MADIDSIILASDVPAAACSYIWGVLLNLSDAGTRSRQFGSIKDVNLELGTRLLNLSFIGRSIRDIRYDIRGVLSSFVVFPDGDGTFEGINAIAITSTPVAASKPLLGKATPAKTTSRVFIEKMLPNFSNTFIGGKKYDVRKNFEDEVNGLTGGKTPFSDTFIKLFIAYKGLMYCSSTCKRLGREIENVMKLPKGLASLPPSITSDPLYATKEICEFFNGTKSLIIPSGGRKRRSMRKTRRVRRH